MLDVNEALPATASTAPTSPLVACVLGPGAAGTLIGFAHEGGRLPVAPSWNSDDIAKNVVALHDGKVIFAKSESELLRALATRTLRQNVVVFLGAPNQLDDELAACAITVKPRASGSDTTPTHKTLPMSPTTSCFSGRRLGWKWAFSKSAGLNPSGAGKLRMAIGSKRAMSAFACSIVTPGFKRARARWLKLPSFTLLRSH